MATQGIWLRFKSIFEHMKNNSSFPGYGYFSRIFFFFFLHFKFWGAATIGAETFKTTMGQEHDSPGFKFTKLPFPLQ